MGTDASMPFGILVAATKGVVRCPCSGAVAEDGVENVDAGLLAEASVVVTVDEGDDRFEVVAQPGHFGADDMADDRGVDLEVGVGEDDAVPTMSRQGTSGCANLISSASLEAASPRISIHRWAAA